MKRWKDSDIRRIISDDSGNPSSKRVLAISWGLAVLCVWVVASVKNFTLVPIPWEIVGLVTSLSGVVAAGKWGEK